MANFGDFLRPVFSVSRVAHFRPAPPYPLQDFKVLYKCCIIIIIILNSH